MLKICRLCRNLEFFLWVFFWRSNKKGWAWDIWTFQITVYPSTFQVKRLFDETFKTANSPALGRLVKALTADNVIELWQLAETHEVRSFHIYFFIKAITTAIAFEHFWDHFCIWTRLKSALRARPRCARMEPYIQCDPWGPHGPDQHLGSALEGSPEKARPSHPIIRKGYMYALCTQQVPN